MNKRNTPKVLWKIINRERGLTNNIVASNIHLHDGNEKVSRPREKVKLSRNRPWRPIGL
jgi:hypothetical protein